MTYRLGIDVGERTTDWVALTRERGVDSTVASGTVASVVALIGGELLAGSRVAEADPTGLSQVTGDFARRLGDAEPLMVGGTPYGPESLVGHLLASIVSDARSMLGSEPGAVVLVHDDGIDDYRRGLWAEAGRLAGLPLAQLILLPRADALAGAAAAGGIGGGSAAGAAKVGWERHPGLPGPEASGFAGGTLGTAAGAGAAAAGGGVLAATVLGGGEAIAAAPVGGVGLGPAGTPLSAPVGPAGTPLSAPVGPAGTPLSAPVGPAGTPLSTAVRKTAIEATKRSYRIPIIGGSIAAAALVAGVAVLAAGGDDPVAAPPTTVVATPDAALDSVAPSTVTEPEIVVSTASSAPATSPQIDGVPACTVGTWVMDNDSFAARWAAVAGQGSAAALASVNGTVTVEVDANGVWTSSYTDWGFTVTAGEVTIDMSIAGSDTSTGTFGEDGSFTFVENGTNTVVTMTATSGGVDLPIPPQSNTQSAFSGRGTYVCEGDTMTVISDEDLGSIIMNRTA